MICYKYTKYNIKMAAHKPELHIITGPMFSGKTSTLLTYLSNASYANLSCLYINHTLDDRTKGAFSSHSPFLQEEKYNKLHIDFVQTDELKIVYENVKNYDVIGIDEAQFFEDLDIVKVMVNVLKKHVVVSGLIADYKRKKFGKISDLFVQADSIQYLTAVCKTCGDKKIVTKAIHTHRISNDEKNILIGAQNEYIPLCRDCYNSLN